MILFRLKKKAFDIVLDSNLYWEIEFDVDRVMNAINKNREPQLNSRCSNDMNVVSFNLGRAYERNLVKAKIAYKTKIDSNRVHKTFDEWRKYIKNQNK